MVELLTGTFGIVLYVFLLLLLILWILLPFAIFGFQKKLEAINNTNWLILQQLKNMNCTLPDAKPQTAQNDLGLQPQQKKYEPTSQTCPKCMQENGLNRTSCSRCGDKLINL